MSFFGTVSSTKKQLARFRASACRQASRSPNASTVFSEVIPSRISDASPATDAALSSCSGKSIMRRLLPLEMRFRTLFSEPFTSTDRPSPTLKALLAWSIASSRDSGGRATARVLTEARGGSCMDRALADARSVGATEARPKPPILVLARDLILKLNPGSFLQQLAPAEIRKWCREGAEGERGGHEEGPRGHEGEEGGKKSTKFLTHTGKVSARGRRWRASTPPRRPPPTPQRTAASAPRSQRSSRRGTT